MSSTTRSILRWWHVLFGIVALFFAAQYLRDGLADGGAVSDTVKGVIWVALAVFMIVPESVRRRAKDRDDAA